MRKPNYSGTTLLALLALIAMTFQARGGAQIAPATGSGGHIVARTIVTARGSSSYPMGLIIVLYDGRPTLDRVPFDAPDDWLKHVTIAIRNESAKNLIAGSIQVAFPGIGGDPMIIRYIRFGVTPEHQLITGSGEKVEPPRGETATSVPPGGYIRIPLATDYDSIRSAIEKRVPLSQATTCVIDYGVYYFDDDMRWSINSFRRADPTIPGKYAPMAPEELLGRPQTPSR